jgi:hypothetical protein
VLVLGKFERPLVALPWLAAASLAAAQEAAPPEPVLFWRGALASDQYQVDVEIPAGGGGSSGLQPGRFHKSTASGDLRMATPEGGATQLQFALTASDDRAVLSRFRSQVGTLQLGRSGPGHQVLLGDTVAHFSRLAGGIGLRGALGSVAAGPWTASGYAGAIAESWESLWGAPTRDGGPARLGYSRSVHGASAGYNASSGLQAFVTHQAWADRGGSVSDAIAAALPATQSGRVSTGGLRYAAALGALGQLQLGAERGLSTWEEGAAGASGDAGATMLDATLQGSAGDTTWQLRAGRNAIDPDWRGVGAQHQPGLRETFSGFDVQLLRGLTLGGDARRADIASPFEGAGSAQASRTWRLAAAPAALPGWTFTAMRTTQSSAQAGSDTQARQDSANVDYTSGATAYSVGWSRLAVSYALYPYADGTTQELRAGIRQSVGPASSGGWGWDSAQWSVHAGRQVQRSHYPTEMRTDFVQLTASVAISAQASFSADVERRLVRDVVAGDRFHSTSLGLQWQRSWRNGMSLRLHLRRNHLYRGLLSAEVMERTAGLVLGYAW